MDDLILSLAIEKWGEDSQIGMAIEECAECIVALRKLSRVGGRDIDSTKVHEAVIDEIADVTIMMRQLAMIFGFASVENRIKYKIERLKVRLEK